LWKSTAGPRGERASKARHRANDQAREFGGFQFTRVAAPGPIELPDPRGTAHPQEISTMRSIIFAALASVMSTAAVTSPPADLGQGGIMEVMKSRESFTRLLEAMEVTGLADALENQAPFTVFAPSDAAFASLPAHLRDTLFDPANKDQLRKILKHHIVEGRYHSHVAVQAGKARTLKGTELPMMAKGSKIMVSGARVLSPNIDARNGVIHVIDRVIIP
jgi:uncharacterized surface protein with fasciclin (FAS1) repeats